MEKINLTAHDGLPLSVVISKAEETQGLVQIIHGAKEHKGRYYHFIEFLNKQGFTVIISDNRGHGESVNHIYPLGYMNGVEQMVADQVLITDYIKSLYPDKKLYLFGHSLGSLFARCYLQEHDERIEKLVLCGTANYIQGVNAGILAGKLFTFIAGKHGYSKIMNHLSSNKKDDSWISRSQTNLEAYRKDPKCQFQYKNNAALTIFEADSNMHKFEKFQCKNPHLEILSISGEEDPVTGGEKGLKDSIQSLRKAGYRNIVNKVYPDMKHEILNEYDNAVVYNDIVTFLKE